MIGLWVSPDGREHPVAVDHQKEIQRNPSVFGVPAARVSHASRRELLEISDALVQEGWIRFRHFGDTYAFQVRSPSSQLRDVETVLVKVGADPTSRVLIAQGFPEKHYIGTVEDVFNKTILSYDEN